MKLVPVGSIGILWSAVWWYFIYDSPLEDTGLSASEKELIVKDIQHNYDTVNKNIGLVLF